MRNRTKTFSARLSEQEYETLNKEIAKTGLTKSAFIRAVARGYLPKPRPPNGYDEMMSELTEIGLTFMIFVGWHLIRTRLTLLCLKSKRRG